MQQADFRSTVTFRFRDFRNVLRTLYNAQRVGAPIDNIHFYDLDLAVLSGEVTELEDGTPLQRDDATMKVCLETNDYNIIRQLTVNLQQYDIRNETP